MNQDFKQIAEQAIKQCQAYQLEISDLKKEASAKADQALAQKSVQALVKVGCLKEAEGAEALSCLVKDHNACLRTIEALCQAREADAQSPVKKEAAAQQLNFGTIVDNRMDKKASAADEKTAYAGVAAILGLKLN